MSHSTIQKSRLLATPSKISFSVTDRCGVGGFLESQKVAVSSDIISKMTNNLSPYIRVRASLGDFSNN
jgi:hypothetical protein